jgi:hypothetical protein
MAKIFLMMFIHINSNGLSKINKTKTLNTCLVLSLQLNWKEPPPLCKACEWRYWQVNTSVCRASRAHDATDSYRLLGEWRYQCLQPRLDTGRKEQQRNSIIGKKKIYVTIIIWQYLLPLAIVILDIVTKSATSNKWIWQYLLKHFTILCILYQNHETK